MDEHTPMRLQWPDGLDAQRFLDEYWQKKPLLLRQALPGFDTPVAPDDLAGMSLEEGTTPRLVLHDGDGRYRVEHGPFDEARFEALDALPDGSGWSLLVTDVEKHYPELADYLEPFDFLPTWRIDDLMISYAPDGSSVGAHVDDYDVFLLQASGTRRWRIDTRPDIDLTPRADCAIKILAEFDPDAEYDLQPGDILYLPPRVPHHGIAVGENCTTWSVGLRAPTAMELFAGIAEHCQASLSATDNERYRDPALSLSTHPGELTADSVAALYRLWQSVLSRAEADFPALAARLLTQRPAAWAEEFAPMDEPLDETQDESLDGPDRSKTLDGDWQVHPFSRLLYIATPAVSGGSGDDIGQADGERVQLFADGDAYRCSRALAERLCTRGAILTGRAFANADATDRRVLEALWRGGTLVASGEPVPVQS